MYKEEAIELFTEYLDDFNVRYRWISTLEDEDCSELFFVTDGMSNSPGEFVETTIDFCDSCISARAYYNVMGQKLVAENLERFPALFRLLNFINEKKNHISINRQSRFDGDEEKSAIFTPQLRMTEDLKHDIKYTLVVDYQYLELFPNQTVQMLVVFLQLYLNSFAPSVFGVLTGKMNLKEAKENIVSITYNKMSPLDYGLPTNKENDEEDDE